MSRHLRRRASASCKDSPTARPVSTTRWSRKRSAAAGPPLWAGGCSATERARGCMTRTQTHGGEYESPLHHLVFTPYPRARAGDRLGLVEMVVPVAAPSLALFPIGQRPQLKPRALKVKQGHCCTCRD